MQAQWVMRARVRVVVPDSAVGLSIDRDHPLLHSAGAHCPLTKEVNR
jgi:hypothetical protein